MEQKKVVKKVVKKPVEAKKKNEFVEKLKANWKNILLILLAIFCLSKCTSSCSRGNKIEKQQIEISALQSKLDSLGVAYDKQNIELSGAKSSIENYKGIATGNQKELIDKVEKLSDENRQLVNKINSLTKERDKLKKQVEDLEKKEVE